MQSEESLQIQKGIMGSTYARLPVVEPLSPAANDAQVPSRQALPRGPSTNSSANAINNNINANAIATLTRVFLIVYPGLVVSTLVLGVYVLARGSPLILAQDVVWLVTLGMAVLLYSTGHSGICRRLSGQRQAGPTAEEAATEAAAARRDVEAALAALPRSTFLAAATQATACGHQQDTGIAILASDVTNASSSDSLGVSRPPAAGRLQQSPSQDDERARRLVARHLWGEFPALSADRTPRHQQHGTALLPLPSAASAATLRSWGVEGLDASTTGGGTAGPSTAQTPDAQPAPRASNEGCRHLRQHNGKGADGGCDRWPLLPVACPSAAHVEGFGGGGSTLPPQEGPCSDVQAAPRQRPGGSAAPSVAQEPRQQQQERQGAGSSTAMIPMQPGLSAALAQECQQGAGAGPVSGPAALPARHPTCLGSPAVLELQRGTHQPAAALEETPVAASTPLGNEQQASRGASSTEAGSAAGLPAAGAPDGVAGAEGADADAACVVCLEPLMPDDEVLTLPCRHRQFHAACIEQWMLGRGRGADCPLCKEPLLPCRAERT